MEKIKTYGEKDGVIAVAHGWFNTLKSSNFECVCVCVCVCVYMHVYICVHVCVCVHPCMHMRTYAYMCVCVQGQSQNVIVYHMGDNRLFAKTKNNKIGFSGH